MATLTKKQYQESRKVKDAYDAYDSFRQNSKPGDYSFSDSERKSRLENDYFNYGDFSYDPNSDPVYNAYKQAYTTQGKKVMEDSMGAAASLTGGYGNSYAATVGQSSYNDYVDKLNDALPELYSAAYSRYESEFDRLESRLGYLSAKDDREYSRYLDDYDAYFKELDDLRDFYFREYENDLKINDSEWESAYKLAMAEQAQKQFEAELALKSSSADKELAYKYAALRQDQSQFDSKLDYDRWLAEENLKDRDFELRLQREKIGNEDAQFWAELNKSTRTYLREDEIYAILGDGGYYEALAALDYNYDDDEALRYKALAMGIDKSYVDAYLKAKGY